MNILEYNDLSNLEVIQDLQRVYRIIFSKDVGELLTEVRSKESPLLLIAYVDGKAAGFKLGWPIDKMKFFSWAGGVDPAYRKRGIASKLMEYQHKKCAALGFKIVETKCRPSWPEMMSLNKTHGFEIVRSYTAQDGHLKYQLEKQLSSEE